MIAWLLPLASFTVICIGYSVPQLLGLRVWWAYRKRAAVASAVRRASADSLKKA